MSLIMSFNNVEEHLQLAKLSLINNRELGFINTLLMSWNFEGNNKMLTS